MAWHDQLGRVEVNGRRLIGASYRGVPFFVDSEERTGGQRSVTFEYPGRDTPYIEPLGLKAGVFAVEGYVLGADWLAQRNALLAALQTAGPGQLRHPTYGVLQVLPSTFRVRTSKGAGRLATFFIEFAQTEEQPRNPSASPSAQALLDASADGAVEASAADFVAQYDVDGESNWVISELGAVLTSASEAMDEMLSPGLTTAEELASLKGLLVQLEADAVSLARRPQDMADRLQAVLVTLVAPELLPRLLEVYAFEPPARPDLVTATRERQAVAYDLVLALIRRGVVIQAARLAPLEEYDSYEAAVARREEIAAALDEQLEVAGDEVYPALQQLRADLVRAVPGEDSGLARLVDYTPPAMVPSLVLAYRLYGDVEMEQDVVDRNRIPSPGFIRAGEPLEVLSGGE